MNVLSNLRKMKTSTDFAAGIDSLETEHAAALAAVGELESQREDTLFEGRNLDALEADIAKAEGKAKTFDIALVGARRRHTEATEAEAQAELEATAATARKLNTKLRARLIDFARVAEELADLAGAIRALRATILTANNVVREGGRGDLVQHDPVPGLVEVVGRQVVDPVKGLVIPEYWPHRAEGGPALLKLTAKK